VCVLGLADSYISVTTALKAAAVANDLKLEILWVEASDLETTVKHEDFTRHDHMINASYTASKLPFLQTS